MDKKYTGGIGMLSEDERQKRLEELRSFKIVLDMDVPDEVDKTPYLKLYTDCIDGVITLAQFDAALDKLLAHAEPAGSKYPDEVLLHLTPEQAAELFKAPPGSARQKDGV